MHSQIPTPLFVATLFVVYTAVCDGAGSICALNVIVMTVMPAEAYCLLLILRLSIAMSSTKVETQQALLMTTRHFAVVV